MNQVQIVRLQDSREVIKAKFEQVDCASFVLVTRANVFKTFNYDLCASFHYLSVQMFYSIVIEF